MEREPTVRAQMLGEELRNARLAAGMTLSVAGTRIGASEGKISRIENGLLGASPADVAGMCALYGIVDPERKILLNMVDSSREQRWMQFTDLETTVRTYQWLQDRATVIVNYQTNYVPGLLQTGEYTLAVMRLLGVAESEAVRRKDERMERKRVLHKQRPPGYAAIVDQSALMRPIGGRDVQRRQLEHLVEVACRMPIDLRIIPLSRPHAGLEMPFVKWEFRDRQPVIYTEDGLSCAFMEDKKARELFGGLLGKLDEVALSVTESVHLIAQLAADLE
jgi:transcriptional regulator with XRE-family HTH domain